MTAPARPRIAFAIAPPGSNWTGGINYYATLLGALADLPDRAIETLVFLPPGVPADYRARFPADRIVETRAFVQRAPIRSLGKVFERTIGRNLVVERLLARHAVDVLSHAAPPGARSPARTIGWVPDFQEAHLPDFFSADEIAWRSAGHRLYARRSTLIVLSSEDARRDLATFYPQAIGKARVLRFVSGIADDPGTDIAALRARHDLPERFFHVPNQLWIHKNHAVVADALAILKHRGIDMTVISTGATTDYRHPDFHARFVASLADKGVADRFRVAGLVPYAEVAALFRHSVAIINPSLFEGWSTTVEEAKSLGKRILLSGIGVHREQAPPRGSYFDPHDPAALADLMVEALAAHDPAVERVEAAKAAAALPARRAAFARTFEAIAREAAAMPAG